jgi:hypothetical protein
MNLGSPGPEAAGSLPYLMGHREEKQEEKRRWSKTEMTGRPCNRTSYRVRHRPDLIHVWSRIAVDRQKDYKNR